MHDVLTAHARGEGTSRVYEAEYDATWKKARAVLQSEGAGPVETHDGYMLASVDGNNLTNLVTSGAWVGVWVEEEDDHHTRVTVVTKRRVSTQILTTLTEDGFLADLDSEMAP